MESDLIQRAQQGDQIAFQQLVECYHAAVWRTARVLIGDRALAEDAVQEAWLDVWRGLARFDVSRPFRPWLLTIVANRCRMLARRSHALSLPLDSPLAAGAADIVAGPDDQGGMPDEIDPDLEQALAALTADQRRIIELHFSADLALTEIALILSVPEGTVKSRLHRALQALRKALRHDFAPAASTEESV